MSVYHGSYLIIIDIDLSKCEIGKDFGQGFYVTNIKEQAQFWATRKGLENDTTGFVTEFDLDEYFLENHDKFKVLRFDEYNDEWLDFVVLNRKNKSKLQAHEYDIVEGPVADDRIATEVDKYLEGVISKENFLKNLTYKPSHQICFCTMQSLQALSQEKGKIDIAVYDIGYEVIQSIMKDYNTNDLDAADKYYTSKTYSKLADETTQLYLQPWQTIYKLLKEELG